MDGRSFAIMIALSNFLVHLNAGTPVRLVDGPHRYAGRLEVFYKGEWGSVCGDYFDEDDATVVCGMIKNFTATNVNATIFSYYDHFGSSKGPVWITNLQCNGTEEDIFFCKSNKWERSSSYCSYSARNVALDCNTQVRQNIYSGLTEILHNEEWGSICTQNFDRAEAEVLCRTQGLSSRNVSYAFNGYGGGPRYILSCSGDEEDVSECNIGGGWYACSNSYVDVTVHCGHTQVRQNIYSGLTEILHNEEWGSICTQNFDRAEAEVLCRTQGLSSRNVSYAFNGYGGGPRYILSCSGDEEDVSECNIGGGWYACSNSYVDVTVHCGQTEVRVVNGINDLQGDLEILYDGMWRRVCYDGFGPNEARAACMMLNGTDIAGTIEQKYYDNGRYGGYTISNLKCTGNEKDLSQCKSDSWHYGRCNSLNAVSIDCNKARLVDGPSKYAGRLEVFINGTWGTVCDYSFTWVDIQVACKSFGYTYGALVSNYPRGHGHVVMTDVQCRGYENDLTECYHNSYNICSSDNYIVGIACGTYTPAYFYPTSSVQTATSIRLVGGNSYYSGRVEIYTEGGWGTICDRNFDYADVQVVCRQLGYNNGYGYGVAYYGAHFGEGSGNVVIEDLECNGYEYRISDCRSKTWLSNGCDHSRDVGVNCYENIYDQTTTSYGNIGLSNGEYEGAVRLVGGQSYHEGRVEVFYNGQWGTVCDDDFDVNEALVICRALGMYVNRYSVAAYGSAYFGQGIGPIIIDDLRCSGSEWGLSQCSSRPWYSHDCGHSEDAGVSCNYYQTTTFAYPWWHVTTNSWNVHGTRLQDAIFVNCDESGWNIRVDMFRLREIYPNAKASDIYLGENTCTGVQSWNTLTFQQGLRECLTSETIRHNVLVYSNELIYAEHDPNYQFIIRHYNWTVGVECDVQRNETSSGHIHHDSSHVAGPGVTGSSHFSVNMSFYSDPNFMYQLRGDPLHVTVGDKVYVKVFTTTSDWTVKLRVHTCYTKPSQYSPDHMKYFIIQNGCEVDTNTHLISQSAHETRFVFQDFEYTSSHEGIHVFCDAIFCGSYDYSRQCQQTCNPVVRRNIAVERINKELTTDETGDVNSDVTTDETQDVLYTTTGPGSSRIEDSSASVKQNI